MPAGDSAAPLPQLAPLDPALGSARHGIDAAAAYLLVTLADLNATTTLPEAFASQYFNTTSDAFVNLVAEEGVTPRYV